MKIGKLILGGSITLLLVVGWVVKLLAVTNVSGDVVQIQWWTMFAGPDGQHALQLVRDFNRENPDVHVTMQRMDASLYYSKMFVAGLGGRSPEVFVVHADVLPRFQKAGLLRPIDDLLSLGSIDPSDFDPAIWDAIQFEGKAYSLPLDVHPIGMYYNARLLREAGVVDTQGHALPPQTTEAFIDTVSRFPLSEGRYGFAFAWQRINAYSIMRQFGGRMFTDDYSRCTLNDPENIEALQWCVDLIYESSIVPNPNGMDPYTGFRQGKVAMLFEGPWMATDFAKQEDLELGYAPIPQFGGQPAAWANSHNLCIRPDLEGRELESAWRFVEYLSDHSLRWAQAGQIPARRSIRNDPQFAEMDCQSSFATQIPQIVFMPRTPVLFEFLSEFDLAVERSLSGQMNVKQALSEATNRVNQSIERALEDKNREPI